MRPIIFLDIDGVLNTPSTFPVFDKSSVCWFNKLVKETNPRVVISSSWRYLMHNGFFTKEGFEFLLLTHNIILPKGSIISYTVKDEVVHSREDQIKEWLTRNAYSGKFCVIDDLTLNIPNFVKVDQHVGFCEKDLWKAYSMLTG